MFVCSWSSVVWGRSIWTTGRPTHGWSTVWLTATSWSGSGRRWSRLTRRGEADSYSSSQAPHVSLYKASKHCKVANGEAIRTFTTLDRWQIVHPMSSFLVFRYWLVVLALSLVIYFLTARKLLIIPGVIMRSSLAHAVLMKSSPKNSSVHLLTLEWF